MTIPEEVKRMRFQIKLLSENVRCRFWQGDEARCLHPHNPYELSDAPTHYCYNCDGNISECDYPIGKE